MRGDLGLRIRRLRQRQRGEGLGHVPLGGIAEARLGDGGRERRIGLEGDKADRGVAILHRERERTRVLRRDAGDGEAAQASARIAA